MGPNAGEGLLRGSNTDSFMTSVKRASGTLKQPWKTRMTNVLAQFENGQSAQVNSEGYFRQPECSFKTRVADLRSFGWPFILTLFSRARLNSRYGLDNKPEISLFLSCEAPEHLPDLLGPLQASNSAKIRIESSRPEGRMAFCGHFLCSPGGSRDPDRGRITRRNPLEAVG